MRNLRPGKRDVDETLVAEAMRDGIDRIRRAAWSISKQLHRISPAS